MQVYNGEIIVCSTAPDGNWLHIYDRTNGEMKASAIPQGRGPGEGLNLHSSYLDMSTETLCYYDFNMHKLLSIDFLYKSNLRTAQTFPARYTAVPNPSGSHLAMRIASVKGR
jgi:hypothetical protein